MTPAGAAAGCRSVPLAQVVRGLSATVNSVAIQSG